MAIATQGFLKTALTVLVDFEDDHNLQLNILFSATWDWRHQEIVWKGNKVKELSSGFPQNSYNI